MLKRLKDIVRSHYYAAVLPKEAPLQGFAASSPAFEAAQTGQRQQERAGWKKKEAKEAEGERQTRRPAGDGAEADLEAAYLANLELTAAASFAAIKAQYKRLLKRYHPDLYHSEPEKLALALEVTRKLNEAYHYFREKNEKNITQHKF